MTEQEAKVTSSPGVVTRKLRYSEIPSALEFSDRALKPDPFQHYLRDTKDSNNTAWNTLWYLVIGTGFTASVRDGLAYTFGPTPHAIITYSRPSDSPKARPPLERFLRWIVPLVLGKSEWLMSKEQRKRMGENRSKVQEAVKQTLGDRVKGMYYVDRLATDPKYQGQGYGTALVGVCTAEADRHGRATWVISSNGKNTGFYNACGFYTKAEIVLGDENPEWDEPPVVIYLMVRETKTPDDKGRPFEINQ